MKKINISIIIFFLIMVAVFAQQHTLTDNSKESSTYLIGAKRAEGIKLRFGATNAKLSEALSNSGLMLEKAEWKNNQATSQLVFQSLGLQKLKPKNEWPSFRKNDSSYLASTFGLLFLQKEGKSEEESRFKWTILNLLSNYSWDVATHLGVGYLDREVDLKGTYVYRIFSPLHPEWDTVYTTIQGNVPESLPSPQIDSVSLGEQSIKLIWNKFQDSTFIAYHIEKALGPEGPFSRINEAPYMDFEGGDTANYFTFLDGEAKQNIPYWYRIQAINCYGELTSYSKKRKVVLMDQTPPAPPVNVKVSFLKKDRTRISWEYPYEIENGLNFSILMGQKGQKINDYTLLNPDLLGASQRSFEFEGVAESGSYFVVLASDSLGNAAMTLPVFAAPVDSIPPVEPQALAGSCDSLG
ncbi:MAG: hypothetical protein AAFP89_25480, partial [Bacteroidota bacterium]